VVRLLRVRIKVTVEFIHSWDDSCDACSVLREEDGSFFVGLRKIV
jgi:hypothetical protein